jgi:hypothetical protein
MSPPRATIFWSVIATFLATSGSASVPPPGSTVLVFTIAKSQNKNQVQYVVRVDDHCVPIAPAPMAAYWRMLEQSPTATAPLLPREAPAYGLASQQIIASDRRGGRVRATLRALTSRPLTVETSRGRDGKCTAVATLPIAGQPARLFNVYVALKWNGVDSLLLRGWSMDGSRVIKERITM